MSTKRKPSLSTLRCALLAFAASLGLLAASSGQAFADRLNVVTTTSDLASITRSIAGRAAEVNSICTGREDAHFLQARPSYILMARDADLWIRAGLELEVGWEGPVLQGSRNRHIQVGAKGHLDAGRNVIRREVPEGRLTRALGDVHAEGNPHYLMDPLNARIVANDIAEKLIELAPRRANAFRANLAAFQRALDERMFGKELVEEVGGSQLWAMELRGELDKQLAEKDLAGKLGGWRARLMPHRGKRFVAYHKNWGHLAERFGIEVLTELEPKPGIPPTMAHLGRVIEQMRATGTDLIFQANLYPTRAADRVAARTGARVVVAPLYVGGMDGTDDYFALMDRIVQLLSEGLAG